MRQLFVPACLCVMTWSNTTGFDLPIEKFTGPAAFDKKVLARAAEADGAKPSDEPVAAGADDGAPGITDEPPDADAPAAETTADLIGKLRPAIDPQKVPLPPVPRPVVHRSRREICDSLTKAAQTNALPLAYFIRLLFQESGFDEASVSSAGAQGIAQFMPETAASEGLKNPFDPLQAIPASARLLRKLFEQFGNLGLAAAAYNAGPKRVQDWLASKGKGKLPDETQGYVKIVTGRPADTWRVASATGTALTVPRAAPCQEAVPPAPPEPPHARIVTASNASARAHEKPAHARDKVVPAKAGVVAVAKPATHKTVEQLAARKHKAKPTHVAQR